ncbi:hypothetical protein AB3N59_02770 [Leptospira sp. WS92.C1]
MKLKYLFFIFFQACSAHYFMIPKEQVQTEIKKILVLPLYVNPDFLPAHPIKDPTFQFDSKEMVQYIETLNRRGAFLTKFIDKILREGEYRFVTVPFSEDLNQSAQKFDKVEIPPIKNEKRDSKIFVFRPKKDLIQSLAKKYQVDAVFFHTIYGSFDNSTYFRPRRRIYVFLPAIDVFYEPTIYKASGELIFNEQYLSSFLSRLHKAAPIPEDSNRFVSIKRAIPEIAESLSKSDLMYPMFTGYGGKGDGPIVSLCTGRFSCEMSYFGTEDN